MMVVEKIGESSHTDFLLTLLSGYGSYFPALFMLGNLD